MKGRLGFLGLLFAILPAAPAGAATLYKCIGDDGIPSYVSKRVRGASCSAVSSYQPSRSPVRAPAPALPPPAANTQPADAAAKSTGANSAPVTPLPAAKATPAASSRTQRVVSGQVYTYMKDGVRHYTSAKPAQLADVGDVRTIRYSYIERCFACGTTPSVNFGSVRLNTTSFKDEIAAAAREFGVEEAVVRAVIHAESAYNPLAISRAGAQGLMQLMPPTARRFGVGDAFDAAQNIRGGVQYLAWLLKRFNGNLTLAAAGYNAGEGAVDRHGGVPPYRETQYYVQRVAQLADRYRGALASTQ